MSVGDTCSQSPADVTDGSVCEADSPIRGSSTCFPSPRKEGWGEHVGVSGWRFPSERERRTASQLAPGVSMQSAFPDHTEEFDLLSSPFMGITLGLPSQASMRLKRVKCMDHGLAPDVPVPMT